MKSRMLWLGFTATAVMGISGCEQKGPIEQAGEEIDEAVQTAKDGRESTATKVDDAVDELREGAADAAEELKNK
jgi:predicted small lipoprotein YifL